MFWKLHSSQTVSGISLKTQELYVIVFVARYLDLFWNFLSIYNWVMKVIFITASLSIVYIIRFGVPHKDTYNKEDDAFPTQYLLIPTVLLGMAGNQDHSSPFEMVWAFSIYLEAVAILPQLFMLQKQGGAESLVRRAPQPKLSRRTSRTLGRARLLSSPAARTTLTRFAPPRRRRHTM